MTTSHDREPEQGPDAADGVPESADLSTTRRGFLGTAAGLTAGVALLAGSSREAASADVRGFVIGSFFLDLDGAPAGFIKSVEGGTISAEVVSEPLNESFFAKKHLGTPKYEDFELQAGFSMSKAVYDWISATWTGQAPIHDGAVHELDFRFNAVRTREFTNALITEVGIPAMDASSKDPAFLSLKLSPEVTRAGKGSGKIDANFSKTGKAETFLPSNFSLEIDGLDCSKVNKIDSFSIKQTIVGGEIGSSRDFSGTPVLEFPNLSITLAETSAQAWRDWFEQFVVQGNNSEDQERGGRLFLLSSNRVDVLATISFFNLGIFRLSEARAEAGGGAVRRVTAELYCERMEFKLG